MTNQIEIRCSKETDALELEEISSLCFSEPWKAQDFLDTMRLSNARIFFSFYKESVIGYVVLYFAADEGEIPSIAVRTEFARQGAASLLMQEVLVLAEIKQLGKIFLEVRRSNCAAIGLYVKNGFICVGERCDFYRNPTEDALLMMCPLTLL